MPYRRTRKARGAVSRPGKPGLYRKAEKKSIPNSLVPFKRSHVVTLRYSQNVNLSSTTGSFVVNTFNVNSCNDPDGTGTGHQPRYFDTLCGADGGSAPYLKYRVLGAKITCRFVNDNGSAGSIGDVGMTPRLASAGSPDDADAAAERLGSVSTILGVADSGNSVKTLSKNISIKRWLGVKDLKDNSGTLAVYNANPSDLVKCDVWYQPLDGATTTSVYCRVYIDMIVQFTERAEVAGS